MGIADKGREKLIQASDQIDERLSRRDAKKEDKGAEAEDGAEESAEQEGEGSEPEGSAGGSGEQKADADSGEQGTKQA